MKKQEQKSTLLQVAAMVGMTIITVVAIFAAVASKQPEVVVTPTPVTLGAPSNFSLVDMKECYVEDHVRMQSRRCEAGDFTKGRVLLVNYGK